MTPVDQDVLEVEISASGIHNACQHPKNAHETSLSGPHECLVQRALGERTTYIRAAPMASLECGPSVSSPWAQQSGDWVPALWVRRTPSERKEPSHRKTFFVESFASKDKTLRGEHEGIKLTL